MLLQRMPCTKSQNDLHLQACMPGRHACARNVSTSMQATQWQI